MSYSIEMYYGDYQLSPVPIVTLNKLYDRSSDQTAIGSTFELALRGYLYSSENSIVDILDKQTELREAFDEDGKYFRILCDSTVIFECYPRITNNTTFNPTSNNWVTTAEYDLTLEFDNEPASTNLVGDGENIDGETTAILMPPFIKTASESWSLEVIKDKKRYSIITASGTDRNPYQFRLSHNVSAVGKRHYDSGGLRSEAWQEASGWVIPRLGYNQGYAHGSGAINIDVTNLTPYNHVKTQQIDKYGGGFTVNEEWVVLDLNSVGFVSGAVIEDYNVDYDSSLTEATDNIHIRGVIEGLEIVDYDPLYSVTTTAYESASGYWNTIKGSLAILPRAQAIANLHDVTLNILPLTTTVAHSPANGSISYDYTYNNRPSDCITGNGFTIKHEEIQIIDNGVTDIFANILVPGRSRGPILMDVSTVTAPTREVNIDLIVNPFTGCISHITPSAINTSVNSFLCDIETELSGAYDQVFKHQDNTAWLPKTGRYSRNVGWTMGICTSDALTTSLC